MELLKKAMEKINEILNKIRPEVDYLSSKDFITDGLLDSFDLLILVSELDSHYAISIDGTDIIPENFENIDSIHSLISKYTNLS